MGTSALDPPPLRTPQPSQNPGRIQNRAPNSGLQYSYAVDYRALRWTHVLVLPRALGSEDYFLRHHQVFQEQA